MAHLHEGTFSSAGLRFGIAVSRFNEFITKPMFEGALNELRRAGVPETLIHVAWVPGAYEIPLACQTLVEQQQCDALIAIGCIIRGDTSHYEHIAQSVANHLQTLVREKSVPIGFGVITVENLEQAIDRAGGKHGNKGRDAARSSLEMANLMRQMRAEGKPVSFHHFTDVEF